ncbi:hypothetical protein [Aquipseudomonas campi]|uniref:hypothetical protein n=1 Tax=Aquipseudomonas campi TaxID=2731681 RepID=UPI00159B3C5C|nr:hypothetical protein [Pseudomonas campi]
MLAWRSNSPEGTQPLRDTSLAWLLAGIVCLGGLALTLGLSALLSNFYQHQLEQRFDAVAKDRASLDAGRLCCARA